MADIDETMTAEVTRLAREAQRLSSELAVIATTAEDLAEKGPSNWLVEDEGALNGALYFVSKLVYRTPINELRNLRRAHKSVERAERARKRGGVA